MRLAILTSHPIQYYAPLFREVAQHVDAKVFFAHRATPQQQAAAGFGTAFEWDVDLLAGYAHQFLRNVAHDPGVHHFAGCDTPDIGKELAAGGFDALLLTGWHLKSYWQGVWAAKRHGIRTIVRGDSHLEVPRSSPKRAAKRALYPMMLRLFDAALFVGLRNRAYYEHYHYPAERLFRSPHCVDAERFMMAATPSARAEARMRLGIAPDEKAILFAGRLVPFKRPLDLIAAAAILKAQGLRVHLIVAGSGALDAEVRTRAAAFDVPLHLLGFQNQTRMPAAYAAADVMVLPSTSEETWGLVCNEALACGTPIVVSDAVGCAPDLAGDGCAGRVFPVGNIEALAGAVAGVLRSPPAAGDIATKSGSYSIEAATKGIIDAAVSICRGAKVPA